MHPALRLSLAALLLLALVVAPASAHNHTTHDHEPEHCIDCKDGIPTHGCPKPQLCGYQPIMCVDCMDGHAMPKCPYPEYCKDVDCSKMDDCMDGMPMPNCPDPGTCGFEPIACWGCVPGLKRHGCPRPEWCSNNMTTPPCMNCMDGHAMPYCPEPDQCVGEGPMPPAPKPTPKPSVCMMQMLFGADSDTCLFLESWKVTNGAQWFGAAMALLLLAILREGLSVWRVHQHFVRKQEGNIRRMCARPGRSAQQSSNSGASAGNASGAATSSSGGDSYVTLPPSPIPFASAAPRNQCVAHALESVYYAVSLTLGYLLMLAVMTYNVWICLLVVGFCAVCHFACNYLYATVWRKRYVRGLRSRLRDFEEQGGVLLARGPGVVVESDAKPVSGDHCCDDLEFDDM